MLNNLNAIKTLLYIIFMIILIWQVTMSDNSLLGKQEASFELDGNTYIISNMGNAEHQKDPLTFKNVGTRITCDALKDITGQDVKLNPELEGTKSFISGKKLSADCIEPFSKTVIDYLPKEYYDFTTTKNNKDIYEYYDRIALNEYKKQKLTNMGYNYFTVPYKIDHKDENSRNIKERKDSIKTFMKEKIYTSL